MDRLRGLIKHIRGALRSTAAERDMRDELAFHLDQEAERNRRRGMTPTEARRRALLAFGSAEAVKEEMRGAGVRGLIAEALRDLRHAMRGIRRRPTLALAVMVTLGLGIGISTAMYSVVHAVVVRPLPYPQAERLVAVWETYPGWRGRPMLGDMWDRIGLAWPDYEVWRANQRAFEEVAVFAGARLTATGGATPELIRVGRASGSLWSLLGVSPASGRLFPEAESGPGADSVAVISHEFWHRQFGGDRGAIGRALLLGDRPFTIVGVLAHDFRFAGEQGRPMDVWIPAGAAGMPVGEDNHSFAGMGRLRHSVSIETAATEAERLFLGSRKPGSRGASLLPYLDQVVGTSRRPLLVLLAGTVVLLLIACVNAAALLAGDAARRHREVATRRALGASRGRIIRQFLSEALALSLASAAVGVGIVAAGVPALVALAPPDLPRLQEVGISGGILVFALAAALLTTLVCSATSVLVIARRRQDGGGAASLRVTSGGRRLQPVFVAVQLALLTVLVTAGVLLGRSLLAVRAIDPGFATANVLTAVINAPAARFADRAELVAFYQRLLREVEAVPGVATVSAVSIAPFGDGSESTSVGFEGLPENAPKPEMERRVVLPGFFDLMRIPVRSGVARLEGGAPNVVVSESMAARLWPDRSALGQRISLRDHWYTVEGVVADVRDQALDRTPQGTYYISQQAGREASPRMRLLMRTRVDPAAVAGDVRRTVSRVDSTIPVGEIATIESLMARSLSADRYRTLLVSVFAGAALVLAAVGIFGVTLRVMLRRRREFGVRLALGARPARLVFGTLGATTAGAVAGLSLGTAIAALAMPAVGEYLYELGARDTASYVGSAAFLLLVSLAATAIPAIGAARLNVVEVLREE